MAREVEEELRATGLTEKSQSQANVELQALTFQLEELSLMGVPLRQLRWVCPVQHTDRHS